ncbi:MAG: hypothetical protein ACI84D_003774 [Thalassolituus oleivorans]|jgi:hypothetical protein
MGPSDFACHDDGALMHTATSIGETEWAHRRMLAWRESPRSFQRSRPK